MTSANMFIRYLSKVNCKSEKKLVIMYAVYEYPKMENKLRKEDSSADIFIQQLKTEFTIKGDKMKQVQIRELAELTLDTEKIDSAASIFHVTLI